MYQYETLCEWDCGLKSKNMSWVKLDKYLDTALVPIANN